MSLLHSARLRVLSFALVLVVLHANAAWILRTPAALDDPALIAGAVLVDLTVTVAFAFWFFFVRTGQVALGAVLPVLVVNGVIGGALLPESAPGWARAALVAVVGAAELLIIGLVLRSGAQVVRVYRQQRARGEPLVAAVQAALEVRAPPLVAAIAAAEIGLLVMATRVFARSIPRRAGDAWSVHHDSAVVPLGLGLLFGVAVEAVVVSLLLADWPTAALVHGGLSAYAALWLLGDLTALRLTPTVLHADRLDLRVGLRWRMVIPRAAIVQVRRALDPRPRAALDVSLPGADALVLELDREVEAVGPLGLRRRGRTVIVSVDDLDALHRALTR